MTTTSSFIPAPYISHIQAFELVYLSLFGPLTEDTEVQGLKSEVEAEAKAVVAEKTANARVMATVDVNIRPASLKREIKTVRETAPMRELKRKSKAATDLWISPFTFMCGEYVSSNTTLTELRQSRFVVVRKLILQALFDGDILCYSFGRGPEPIVIPSGSIWVSGDNVHSLQHGTVNCSLADFGITSNFEIVFNNDEFTEAFLKGQSQLDTAPRLKIDRVIEWYKNTYPKGHKAVGDVFKTVLSTCKKALNESVSEKTLRDAIKAVKVSDQ